MRNLKYFLFLLPCLICFSQEAPPPVSVKSPATTSPTGSGAAATAPSNGIPEIPDVLMDPVEKGAITRPNKNDSVTATPKSNAGAATGFNELARRMIKEFQWEAVCASRNWGETWNSASFGKMRVTVLKRVLESKEGNKLEWSEDSMGNPQVLLRAKLFIPRRDDAGELNFRDQVPVKIVQAVSFVPPERSGSSWTAVASPFGVSITEGERETVVLGVDCGKGAWRAEVGRGGLLIEGFVQAGFAASQKIIGRFFKQDQLEVLSHNDSDVSFYLRPVPLP